MRNDQRTGHHWLRVVLRGNGGNRGAVGAVVTALSGGAVLQNRRVMPTRGYLSQVELPITFGLGQLTSVDEIQVRWPDGRETMHRVDGIDRTLEIAQP